MTLLLILYVLAVTALTVAEYRSDIAAQWFFKPAAALGFILIAIQSGALDSAYGQIILAALCLCAVGDVALINRNRPNLFLIGMSAFALGHIAYIFSFITIGLIQQPDGLEPRHYLSVLALGTIVFLFSPLTIVHKVSKSMQLPVVAYTLIILAMCIFAVLTWDVHIVTAALLFAVSDHFVGKDRFVAHKRAYAFAITPLYFGAQALFALSVSQLL